MAETRIANLSRELYKNQSSLNPALFGDQDDDLFRPSLSDDVKVGFFNLDRSCQTQETDVVPLKEMTEVIQVLLKDTSIIKRDLHLTRKKLETDYENKLQDKTFELHSRINQKLQELEAMHVERVGIVRKAYRQQLADALARVETLFQARYEKQKEKEREKHKADMGKLQNQVNTLTQTIQRNESVIITLKQQLANKNKSDEHDGLLAPSISITMSQKSMIPKPSSDCGVQCVLGLTYAEERELASIVEQYKKEKSDEQPPPPKEDTTKIDALSKELAIYKDKLKVKEKELGTLEDELDHRNAEINLAAEKYNNLQIELDKLVVIKEELAAELSEVKHQANRSTEETKLLLEKQKQDIETEAAERAQKAREEALGASSSRMRELQAEFATKISEMTKEKEELEMLLVKQTRYASVTQDFSQQVQMNFMVSLNPEDEPEESMFNISSRAVSPSHPSSRLIRLKSPTHFKEVPHNMPISNEFIPAEDSFEAPASHPKSSPLAKQSFHLPTVNITYSIKANSQPLTTTLPSNLAQKWAQQNSDDPTIEIKPMPAPISKFSQISRFVRLMRSRPTYSFVNDSSGQPNVSKHVDVAPQQSDCSWFRGKPIPLIVIPSASDGKPSSTESASTKYQAQTLPAVKPTIPESESETSLGALPSHQTVRFPASQFSSDERAKNLATPKEEEQPLTDVEKLAKSEKELRIQCEKLLKEIERINSAWEKKFTILQASLYAIKDESYLRTHLEKQHTLLHQATISYTAGTPRQKNRKQQVLPSIPNRSASPDPLASYTVSRASNRHTLENQIEVDSDDEAGGTFSLHQINQPRLNAQSAT